MPENEEAPDFGPRRRERGRPEFGHVRGRRGGRGGFDGGPQRPQRARRGDVRSAILSLLGQEPQNGYRLMKSFETATDGAWRPSPGSIYPTLTQLVEEGLIEATGEGRHTLFGLTEAGRTYIVEHADELEKAWQSATGESEEDLAFRTSVVKLNGAIEQFRIAATEEQRIAGGKAIDDARRALYLILAD
jgi:DNA-binding PadR family transcriptional regulator